MGNKAKRKQQAVLKSRQAAFESVTGPNKGAFKRPGSLNRHKAPGCGSGARKR